MRLWIPRVFGLLALTLSLALFVSRVPRLPSTAAVDLLPLWLGGKAWLSGRDPNDAQVLQAIFSEEGLKLRVGGWYSYYPPTASVLAAPLALLDFKPAAAAWRVFSVFALVVGVWLGSGRAWAGAWVAAVLLQLRVSWIVLPAAQPGPAVVLCGGLALWAIRTRRDVPAAVAVGLGIATKLVPLALVPALVAGRRWRVIVGAAGVVGALLVAVVVQVPGWSPITWITSLTRFVDAPAFAPWLSQEPAWVLALWRGRGLAVFGVLAAAAWVGWRRADVEGVAALGIAAVGLVMAGSHHYHEALVMLPAVAWAMGRSWPMAAWTTALLFVFRTWDRTAPPSALHWIPVGWGVFLAIFLVSIRESLRPARA